MKQHFTWDGRWTACGQLAHDGYYQTDWAKVDCRNCQSAKRAAERRGSSIEHQVEQNEKARRTFSDAQIGLAALQAAISSREPVREFRMMVGFGTTELYCSLPMRCPRCGDTVPAKTHHKCGGSR